MNVVRFFFSLQAYGKLLDAVPGKAEEMRDEDKIEIIVQKEDENDVEESKKKIKKNDSYN